MDAGLLKTPTCINTVQGRYLISDDNGMSMSSLCTKRYCIFVCARMLYEHLILYVGAVEHSALLNLCRSKSITAFSQNTLNWLCLLDVLIWFSYVSIGDRNSVFSQKVEGMTFCSSRAAGFATSIHRLGVFFVNWLFWLPFSLGY